MKQNPLFLLGIGLLLLLTIPSIALLAGWQWHPVQEDVMLSYALYLFTITATTPYALLACAVLAGVILLYLRPPLKTCVTLVTILAISIIAGQAIKSILKSSFAEARPYVVWMADEGLTTTTDFYTVSRPERTALIEGSELRQIPHWQQDHWAHETGFSFPSGHAIFVAQWFFIFLLIFAPRGKFLPIAVVAIWALAIQASRLVLGMHWPADIMLSTLLAAALAYITQEALLRWAR